MSGAPTLTSNCIMAVDPKWRSRPSRSVAIDCAERPPPLYASRGEESAGRDKRKRQEAEALLRVVELVLHVSTSFEREVYDRALKIWAVNAHSTEVLEAFAIYFQRALDAPPPPAGSEPAESGGMSKAEAIIQTLASMFIAQPSRLTAFSRFVPQAARAATTRQPHSVPPTSPVPHTSVQQTSRPSHPPPAPPTRFCPSLPTQRPSHPPTAPPTHRPSALRCSPHIYDLGVSPELASTPSFSLRRSTCVSAR